MAEGRADSSVSPFLLLLLSCCSGGLFFFPPREGLNRIYRCFKTCWVFFLYICAFRFVLGIFSPSECWGGRGRLPACPSGAPCCSTAVREQGQEIHAAMPLLHLHLCFTSVLCWLAHESSSLVLPNATELLSPPSSTRMGPAPGAGMPRSRRRRYLSPRDMSAILDYHNQVRAQVSPPAANMEYMVWDERLARAAEAWAARCVWDHGPPQLMKYVGQNLSIHSGRYRSVVDMVRSWHHEQQHYSFPHPRECNPRCPSKCSGSVCSHYTQMVWASSNRLGCALQACSNVQVWSSTWRRAVLLVCNYAIKGNWIGEAPYKIGRPCSACPPTYGGVCSNNMCFTGLKSNQVSWF